MIDIIVKVCYVALLMLLLRKIMSLRIPLKAFDDFKNKQEKCMKYCFSICKGWYIYSESLFDHKNALFYLSRALTHQFYF